tara:strand:+ start:580 stop:795 length:216 start_codon:yes stop_codon:yes gene_type:complete
MFYVQTATASKHTENVCWTGADMSNHQNEEILENLYDEEYHRLERKYPQLDSEQVATLARYFATKRWEEME